MNVRKRLEKAHDLYAARSSASDYGLDPIAIPHKFKRDADVEVAAFIASCFAYGNRKVFVPLIDDYISRLGVHPASTLLEARSSSLTSLVRDFRYRFNTEQDLVVLYKYIGSILSKHGTMGSYFKRLYLKTAAHPIVSMLSSASSDFHRVAEPFGRSALYLFPSPEHGSTCKRSLMFCRWMVRRGSPDFGLWRWAKPRHLIVPLDTHLKRAAIGLGILSKNASSSLRTAISLTETLKEYDSKDPVRYDYALYSLGADGRK